MTLPTLLAGAITLAVAFTPLSDPVTLEYPATGARLVLAGADYPELERESRDADLYFSGEVDGIMASVLFYRLNETEYWTNRLIATQLGVEADAPGVALASFASRSKLRSLESQEVVREVDGFAYRDVNIESFQGQRLHQKHMYAYCTFGDTLYVQVHLSKIDYSPEDSVRMAAMLAGVSKGK